MTTAPLARVRAVQMACPAGERVDRYALPDALGYAIRARDWALKELGLSVHIFARTSGHRKLQYSRKDGLPTLRVLVWQKMRQYDIAGIGPPSWNQVSLATGCASHATPQEAVTNHRQRMRFMELPPPVFYREDVRNRPEMHS